MSKVYILIDEKNRIIRLDGGYTIENVDVSTWTLIDEGEGDRYNLCQNNYLPTPLLTEDGICRYKFVNGNIEERTEEEIDIDRQNAPIPEPTDEERMEAQVYYTAVMTDTLIEEV